MTGWMEFPLYLSSRSFDIYNKPTELTLIVNVNILNKDFTRSINAQPTHIKCTYHLHKVMSVKKAKLILEDPDYPLFRPPSGRKYQLTRCRTNITE